jgi:hypothetical protein
MGVRRDHLLREAVWLVASERENPHPPFAKSAKGAARGTGSTLCYHCRYFTWVSSSCTAVSLAQVTRPGINGLTASA